MGKRELLAKVKALAEQGFGGEKENAKEILERLMEKYGVDDSEIDSSFAEAKMYTFRYGDEWERRLLHQIIFATTGKNGYGVKIQRTIKKVGCDCTEQEAAEIRTLFDFLSPFLKEELGYMYRAFVYKYNIFPEEDGEKEETPKIGENPEYLREIKKIAYLTMAIDRHTRTLALLEG